MRVSKRPVVGACLVGLSLGSLLPLATAEDDAPELVLTVDASLDGKPLAAAPVRYASVEGPHVDGDAVDIGAWLPVYDTLAAPGASVAARTNAEGRAPLVLSASTSWLVRVGDEPHVQTRLVERGRHASGDTVAFPLVSGEARVRLPHAPPAGWRLAARAERTDLLEACVVSVARADTPGAAHAQIVSGVGRQGAGLTWWHAATGGWIPAGGCELGFERLDRGDSMPRAAGTVRVSGQIVTSDGAPLPDGSHVRVGAREALSGVVPLAADGAFDAEVPERVPRGFSFGGDGMDAWAYVDGYVPRGPIDLDSTGAGGWAMCAPAALVPGVSVRGTAAELSGLPERNRLLIAVAAPPSGQSARDRDLAEIEAAIFGFGGARFLAQPDGSFQTWLSPGEWHLYALPDGLEPPFMLALPDGPHVVVHVADEPVNDVHVPRWPRIEGRVLGPDGVAVAGALVRQGERWNTSLCRTDAQGRFSLRKHLADAGPWSKEDLRDGWPLVVEARGFQRREIPGRELGAEPLVIRLAPGGDVILEARTPLGEPVVAGDVFLPTTDPEPRNRTVLASLDEQGRALVRGLAPGTHTLALDFEATQTREVLVEVRAGSITVVPVIVAAASSRRVLRAVLPEGVRATAIRRLWRTGILTSPSPPAVAADGSVWFYQPEPSLRGTWTLLVEHEGELHAAPWDREPAEAPLVFEPYRLPPRVVRIRLADEAGLPLFADHPPALVTLRRGDTEELVISEGLRRSLSCRLPASQLYDLEGVHKDLARSRREGTVERIELLLTAVEDESGTRVHISPRAIPLPAPDAVVLERLETLTVKVIGPDGPVPFASVSAHIERTGDLERVPRDAVPTWRRVTGRDGRAVLPRDPRRGLVVEVGAPLHLRAPDAHIVVPAEAQSPLVIRLGEAIARTTRRGWLRWAPPERRAAGRWEVACAWGGSRGAYGGSGWP